ALLRLRRGGEAVGMDLALQLAVARLERGEVDVEARGEAEQLEMGLALVHPGAKKGLAPLLTTFRPPAFAGTASNVERFSAPALVLHVRVAELEALVQALAREIELGAVEEGEALRVDDDLHAAALEGLVLG